MVPPETIPNSEVKHFNADGSAGLPCVRVGHCQVKKIRNYFGFFFILIKNKNFFILSLL